MGTGKGSEIGVVPESTTTMNHNSEADSLRLNSNGHRNCCISSKVTGGKVDERKKGPATYVPSASLASGCDDGVRIERLACYNANDLE